MARALTKTDRNGKLYTRPAMVEAAIDAALKDDLGILGQRAWVSDPERAEFLPLECLVYLLRDAWSRRDDNAMRTLMPPLLARCEAILKNKIPDNRLPNAAELREDILGGFSLLFIEDGFGENKNELDFYECRFYRAFRFFRLDYVRRESAHLKELANFEPDTDSSDEETFARISEGFRSQPTQLGKLVENELFDAINNLPSDERKAIILCHVLGLPEESEDPSAVTAAKLCGVTGRTVRNRLSRAAKRLSQFKKGELL